MVFRWRVDSGQWLEKLTTEGTGAARKTRNVHHRDTETQRPFLFSVPLWWMLGYTVTGWAFFTGTLVNQLKRSGAVPLMMP